MSRQTFVVRKFKLLKAQRLRTGTFKLFSFGRRPTIVNVGWSAGRSSKDHNKWNT